MTIPDPMGCEWPVDPACLSSDWEDYDEDVRLRSTALAGLTLRRLTGYRVGGCPVTLRPCAFRGWNASMPVTPYYGPTFVPYMNRDGLWLNTCGCRSWGCDHSIRDYVVLPSPVGPITSVKVAGVALVPTDYRLWQDRLYKTSGTWPASQDLGLPDTEPDTFSITYLNAYPVDGTGAWAAGVLAMEYALACVGKKCRLPDTVSSISRQGVTYDIPTGAFPNGMTGLKVVDTYIALWNPNNLRQAAKVWVP